MLGLDVFIHDDVIHRARAVNDSSKQQRSERGEEKMICPTLALDWLGGTAPLHSSVLLFQNVAHIPCMHLSYCIHDL